MSTPGQTLIFDPVPSTYFRPPELTLSPRFRRENIQWNETLRDILNGIFKIFQNRTQIEVTK